MADLTITTTSVKQVSGRKSTAFAGAAITAGQAIRVVTENRVKKAYPADCETSATTARANGIALNGASTDQPVQYIENGGVVAIGATVVAGMRYVLSAAGKIAPYADLAANDWITEVAVAETAANLRIDINVTGIQHA